MASLFRALGQVASTSPAMASSMTFWTHWKAGGNAAFQGVKKGIERAMAGEGDATGTNALNKEAMNKALEY